MCLGPLQIFLSISVLVSGKLKVSDIPMSRVAEIKEKGNLLGTCLNVDGVWNEVRHGMSACQLAVLGDVGVTKLGRSKGEQ